MKASIHIAAELLGGQAALARAAGVSQPAAFKWLHDKSKPGPIAVLAIERATFGRVTRHALRPDIYPLPPDQETPDDLSLPSSGTAENHKET
jgi:DNA-binding transcriptional regulator YdaS (Cro superfamily)